VQLKDMVHKIRSKNAGPFWVSVDVFCGSAAAFNTVQPALKTETVARVFNIPVADIKRFDIASLHTIKFSFPRAIAQGARLDRDMHGAQFSHLLTEMDVSALAIGE